MKNLTSLAIIAGTLLATPVAAPLMAQQHDHAAMTAGAARAPTSPGQAAYGAIAEIVAILEADSTTDWSRVNLEALRQHLIDMDAVTLRAAVRQVAVPGGLTIEATGTGATRDAIRRMVAAHTGELNALPDYQASFEEIPAGARLVVRARRPDDARTAAKIRGLGFIGLLTAGAHHGPHHLALARGAAMTDHAH